MGRFADALRQEPAQQPTQQVAQQPAQGGRFTQALRQTPEERTKLSREFTHPAPQEQQTTLAEENLPELGSGGLLSGEDPAKAAQMGFLLLSVTDPQEISKIVRSEFPHIKQQQDANRNEILFNPKTGAQIMINKPGLSKADILQGGATAAAFTPAGAFAAAGKTTASKVGRGALASGLTEAGFQGLQQQAGGEFDVPDVALATGLGGAAELVKPAIDTVGTAFKRRRLKKELGPDDIKTQAELEDVARLTEESRRVSRETKIPLTKAQQTGLESDLTRQRIVGSLSAGSRKARDFLKKQSQASLDAVDELLERVSPATAVETGETRFRTAAQKAIDARVASRKQKSDKLFKGAMKQGADVNLINTRSLIDKALGVAPEGSPLQREMTAIQRAIADGAPRTAVGTLTGPRKPSLRKLQLAKFQIDAVLDGSGGKVIDNVVKAEVVKIQKELVKAMGDASPLYKKANTAFEKASPAIKELQDSILGRVAAVSDTQLKSIAGKIFDPENINVARVAHARKVIEEVDPDAWNQLFRVHMEKQLGKMKARPEDIGLENIPSQLQTAIFGKGKQKNVLMAGAPKEVRETLDHIDKALKRAAKGRPGGSDTAKNIEALKEFKSKGIIRGIVDFFTTPSRVLVAAGDEALSDKKIRAAAKALFDPNWAPKLKAIRRTDITDPPAAAKAMAQLLNDIEKE